MTDDKSAAVEGDVYVGMEDAVEVEETVTKATTTTTTTTTKPFDYFGNKDSYGDALSDAIPDASQQDIAEHVRALRATFQSGATKDFATRRDVLRSLQRMLKENEDVINKALWRDLHKHPTESMVCELSQAYAEIQTQLNNMSKWSKPRSVGTDPVNIPAVSQVKPDPFGVVCIIGTWNYPINLLFVPLASAISAGNCALVRLPGEDTTQCLNNVLISLFDKYVDKRFVRYVYGGVDETKVMLQQEYDLIFATGGNFLGKIVARAAAEYLTPTVLEMGGKSPVIIDETTDIALAARRVAWGAFLNSGQTCVRPDYVLVDSRIGDKFAKGLEEQIVKFFGENPQESDAYCRIVNQRSFARVNSLLEADREHITHGGQADANDKFIAPTVLNFRDDLAAFTSSAVMSQELFGPVLPVFYYPAGDFDWAIRFVTERPKPLALYHFSTKSHNKQRIATETTSGSLVFNDTMMQLTNSSLPFGGVGPSGMGSYHGRHGFEAFSHHKAVMYKYSLLDLAARYPPYSRGSENLLRLALHPFTKCQIDSAKFVVAVVIIAVVVVVLLAIHGLL